jgi:hypothetical protein
MWYKPRIINYKLLLEKGDNIGKEDENRAIVSQAHGSHPVG